MCLSPPAWLPLTSPAYQRAPVSRWVVEGGWQRHGRERQGQESIGGALDGMRACVTVDRPDPSWLRRGEEQGGERSGGIETMREGVALRTLLALWHRLSSGSFALIDHRWMMTQLLSGEGRIKLPHLIAVPMLRAKMARVTEQMACSAQGRVRHWAQSRDTHAEERGTCRAPWRPGRTGLGRQK